MRTSVKAVLYMVDASVIADASPTTSYNDSSVADIALLESKAVYANYGTTELNQFLLDGSEEIAPTGYEVPFWSSAKSLSDCSFASNPTINVSFTNSHSTSGLTLYFVDKSVAEIKIAWFSDSSRTSKIKEKTFEVSGDRLLVTETVDNFKGITIEFTKTAYPGQCAKLAYVSYGQEIVLNDEDIVRATVDESIDATSITVPINYAEITIIDEANAYNIQNPDGLWKYIESGFRLEITETVDGEDRAVGTFFIDTWESADQTVTFQLTDILGYIDKSRFIGGIYTNATVGSIVASIMASANYLDYAVDNSLASIQLSGYLPIMSHREALQQIAFACGGIIDCTRGSTLRLLAPDKNVDSYILLDRKFNGSTKVTLDEYVSGVQLTCKKYTASEQRSEIFNGYLGNGRMRIEFSEPYASLNISGATIEESGANYAIINIASSGTVVLSGLKYDSTEFTILNEVNTLADGQVRNTKSIGALYIYNITLLPSIVSSLLEWYSLRQLVSLEYIVDSEKVGNWVGIQDNINTSVYATTRILSQTIDLTGGYIATAECRGYSIKTSATYTMGNDDLIMNEVLI